MKQKQPRRSLDNSTYKVFIFKEENNVILIGTWKGGSEWDGWMENEIRQHKKWKTKLFFVVVVVALLSFSF